MQPALAVITMFAGNFAPQGWMFCHGQLLPINQYQALYSLLGTTYGGDGETTFGLPDLRGRSPMHAGAGSGLSSRPLGQKTGQENVTLNQTNLPPHTHTGVLNVGVSTNPGNLDEVDGSILAASGALAYAGASTANTQMGGVSASAQNTGGSQAFSNRQPYLGMNYIIAIQGLFPSSN